MQSTRCCHNLQSNAIGIYQQIAPLQMRNTCYQGKTWRLTEKIFLPGWIFFLRIRRRLPFCNELQAEIKTCIFYRCRLGWFLQTDLGRPLHCDTRRTKLVNEGFTRIPACVVTYYFICLDRKQFFSSRTPLLRILVIADTKSPPSPPPPTTFFSWMN